jgi:hypothetical protein
MDLTEVCWDGMDWIDADQRRALVNKVMNFTVP